MNAFLSAAAQTFAIVYVAAIVVVVVLEWVAPRRRAGDTLALRWFSNFGVSLLGTLVLRALFPLVGVSWAAYCAQQGWGLFNRIAVPPAIAIAVTVIALDLLTYAEHYLFHSVPLLWRLHRTHHTDQEYDFTTAIRFHPLESISATLLSTASIALLGAPVSAVLASQIVMIVAALVAHANVSLPPALDRVLRTLVVTPDLHRVHHSVDSREGNSNFATTFSFWDRLFGTYVAQPSAGHERMQFGVHGFLDRKHLRLDWMLLQPVLKAEDEPAPSPHAADRSKVDHAFFSFTQPTKEDVR